MLASTLPSATALLGGQPELIAFGAGGALLAGLALAGIGLHKSRKQLFATRMRLGELESQLNEVEAALNSESQVMLVWRGLSPVPERVAGSMHGAADVPETLQELATFGGWLDSDSVSELITHLNILRANGRAFNIGVKTLKGELLEADGRAAGTHATLRLRPLAGERRQMTELSYDASKLAKQVQRLSAILDSAPFPVWIRNKDGELSWMNQAYVQAMEAPDMQTVLKSGSTLFRAESIDATREQPATGLIGRAHTILRGAMRAFNIHERAIDGGLAGFAIDVSPLEEAEKELERHIKAHASTLDKLDTAIAIFGPDQRLRFYNQAYAQLWSLDEAWLKTQPSDGEILDRLRAQRSLPEQANFREWRTKQLSSYTTLEMRESFWYLPDGRSLHVICEQHPFGGVTYLYENMTKEYQLESKYNELFDVQRETLDNLADAVGLFGSDGRLKLYNPAFQRMWDLPPPGSHSHLHADQLSQMTTYSSEARAAWQDIRFGLTGLEGSRRKLEGRFADGGKVLRYRAVPLPDGNALLTFSDISDSERAEKALRERAEALEAADRLKNTFLANVSYEIRTPLTSIVGFAETLDLGLAGQMNAKQREYVLDIRRSSDELTGIIDAIIDLSAVDAGAMELTLAPINVTELLERVATKHLPSLERRDMAVDIEVASDVTTFVADHQRVEQVLGHLLSNAIGFSPKGSTIRLGARKQHNTVQIWVADQGAGIDPEFQGKAFERFQSKPLPGAHRGPGLGLAIVKSFTELHGGKVSLSSKLNQGTTVVCAYPLNGPAQGRGGEPRSAA